MAFNQKPQELVDIMQNKNGKITSLGDWCTDLVDAFEQSGNLRRNLDNILEAFTFALKNVEGGDAELASLENEIGNNVKLSYIQNASKLTNDKLKDKKAAILKAFMVVLDAKPKGDPAGKSLREVYEESWNSSKITGKSFRSKSSPTPWSELVKQASKAAVPTKVDPPEVVPPITTTTKTTTNTAKPVGPAFLIHNPQTTVQITQAPDTHDPAPPAQVIPGSNKNVITYYDRNLKTLATDQEPKAKKDAADQDVGKLISSMQAILKKVTSSTQASDKTRTHIPDKLTNAKMSEMSAIDRNELLEILGLDGTYKFIAKNDTSGNATGFIVQNTPGNAVMDVDFTKGNDGIWKTIKVTALGNQDQLGHSTELAAQVTRKLGQTLTTRDGKPILTAKVEGNTPEQLVDAAYDLIFNKHVPIWDERGVNTNQASVEAYQLKLATKKASPIGLTPEEEYKLHQIETVLKYIKTATTLSTDNPEPGVNIFRLANAIKELAEACKTRISQSTNLEDSFKNGQLALTEQAIQNSNSIIKQKAKYDTKDQTVEYGVPDMDVVLTETKPGTHHLYTGPIPPPVTGPDITTTTRSNRRGGAFGNH